jgi:hypothetical protein
MTFPVAVRRVQDGAFKEVIVHASVFTALGQGRFAPDEFLGLLIIRGILPPKCPLLETLQVASVETQAVTFRRSS